MHIYSYTHCWLTFSLSFFWRRSWWRRLHRIGIKKYLQVSYISHIYRFQTIDIYTHCVFFSSYSCSLAIFLWHIILQAIIAHGRRASAEHAYFASCNIDENLLLVEIMSRLNPKKKIQKKQLNEKLQKNSCLCVWSLVNDESRLPFYKKKLIVWSLILLNISQKLIKKKICSCSL
jgi:hypothetical protein